jgi:hypothetical protein
MIKKKEALGDFTGLFGNNAGAILSEHQIRKSEQAFEVPS